MVSRELLTRQPLLVTTDPSLYPVAAMGWSSCGEYLAVGSKHGGIDIWSSVAKQGWRQHIRFTGCSALAWSPDKQYLAAAGSKQHLSILLAQTGEVLRFYQGNLWEGRVITTLSWSPDGERLAIGTRSGVVFLLDLLTGSITRQLRHPRRRVISLAWSPDSRFIASTCGKGVFLWIVATGQLWQRSKDSLRLVSVTWGVPAVFLAALREDGTFRSWLVVWEP
jgi:WD40 repeat protein